MTGKTLARRYARALLAAADKDGNVEDVEGTLLALKDVYQRDRRFRMVLQHPRIPRSKRRAILRRPFEGKQTKAFLSFLDLLVEKKRVNLIPNIAEAFDRLAHALAGIVRVQVRSWKPLDDATRSALIGKLAGITGCQVQLQEEVDPAVKGGMSVQIGDTVIDGTVAYRLKELREGLLSLEKT